MTNEKTPLIDTINSISDFKKIDDENLCTLASEIRGFLVDKVSKNGGHLASNLGVVELTIALDKVFDTSKDKIVFDVGHQAYVHKILTGRKNGFERLRKLGGVGGFPKRSESEHDSFNTGHSSTSISAALGMLRAFKNQNQNSHAVAVIGDGALTGGMAFEALNDAGQSKLPLIVVLNDNEMSIAHNVGALNKHLNGIRSSAKYQKMKRDFASYLSRFPKVGPRLSNKVLRLKTRIKYLILPNVYFEEMGFTYLGPIDGHDINALLKVLNQAKDIGRPVVVHVLTKKGKGYKPAEENPERFHAVGKFDPQTGNDLKEKKRTNSSVFADTICDIANFDNRIMAITAAMAQGTCLDRFQKLYPERFFDVGIAEQHAVTLAAGMAAAGAHPVAAIYSTFLQRAYDQLLHDVCLQNLPVLFGVDRAGLVGDDGETHQGVYDIAYLLTLPHMTIMSPSTIEELYSMTRLAMKMQSGPMAIRYNRGVLPSKQLIAPLVFGKWEQLLSIKEIVVIATGRLVKNCIEACENLDVGLVNARFIRPMDDEMLNMIGTKAKRIIIAEDGICSGGFGMRVMQFYSGRIMCTLLGIPDAPVPQASVVEQDEMCGISAEKIRDTVLKVMEELK